MNWNKNEFIAYVLLFAAHADNVESNFERNIIISKVDMQTFQKIHDEFDKDNDYQSIQKIMAGIAYFNYSKEDINALLVDVKLLFFADGNFDVLEKNMFQQFKKILN